MKKPDGWVTTFADARTRQPLDPPKYPVACMDCDNTEALAYVRTHHTRYLCMGCYNALWYSGYEPVITLMPGRCGGRPTLNNTRLLVEIIAGLPDADAASDYDCTPADYQIARWFQDTWQLRRRGGSRS